MAVVISKNDTTISTANGFYRCEAYNMGFHGGIGNITATTSWTSFNTTFANAGNLLGIGLGITSISSSNTRGIRIALSENKGTFTVTIASPAVVTLNSHGFTGGERVILETTGALPTGLTKTTTSYYIKYIDANTFNLSATSGGTNINTSGTQSGTHTLWVFRNDEVFTYDKIFPPTLASYETYYMGLVVPFTFTTPYAVDTTSGKWRFSLLSEGGTGTFYWLVSDGVAANNNLCYFAWCDNQVSFTDNDVLICKDKVTVDASFSIRGILGTGNTVYSTAGIVCSSLDVTKANVAKLVWENAPTSSYTMTIDGGLLVPSNAGIQIGSEESPIPIAQQALITFTAPTVGTDQSCIRVLYYNTTGRSFKCNSLILYGEIPTNKVTYLATDAAGSQNKIVTTEDMSSIWQVGDIITVPKILTKGQGATGTHAIASFNGTEITLATNLSSSTRLAGGEVMNLSRKHGIEIKNDTDTRYHRIEISGPIYMKVSGVLFKSVYFSSGYYSTFAASRNSLGEKIEFNDNTGWQTTTTGAWLYYVSQVPILGVDIKRNNCFRCNVYYSTTAYYSPTSKSGSILVEDNLILSNYTTSSGGGTSIKITYNRNRYIHGSGYSFILMVGKSPVFTDNVFYGNSANTGANDGAIVFGTFCQTPYLSGNTFDNCAGAIGYTTSGLCLDGQSVGDTFISNTYDFRTQGTTLGDFTILDPIGTINVYTDLLSETTNGYKLRIVNDNEVANVDRVYLTEGYYVRCGVGLADTTVHTDGGFSLRMEAGNEPLVWEQYIPTGDITDKTMAIGVWVKINSANYWSGTHVMPRLTVVYDNLTTAYAEAGQTTDWQLLMLPFKPETSYGRVKATLSIETDQSGSDAYVYWDDMSVLYPAGVQVSLGSLDIWAGAEPITPSISTGLSVQDVWAVPTSGMTGAGTVGRFVTKLLSVSKFLGLK